MKTNIAGALSVLLFVPYCFGQDTPITSAPHKAEGIETPGNARKEGITLEQLNEISDEQLGAALRSVILAEQFPSLERHSNELSHAARSAHTTNSNAGSYVEQAEIVGDHLPDNYESSYEFDEEEPANSDPQTVDESGYGLDHDSRGGTTSFEVTGDGWPSSPDVSADEREYVHELGVGVTDSEAVGEEMLNAETRGGSFDSDRNDVRARISNNGWNMLWGELVNEAEYVKLAGAIAAGSPNAYFQDYQTRTVLKIARNAGPVSARAIEDAIKRAMRGKQIIRVGDIGVKGGIATYRRWKRVVYHEPRTRKTNSPPFFEFYQHKVEKRVPLPNHHQPFVAFRLHKNPGGGSPSGGGSNASTEWVRYTMRNTSNQTIHIAMKPSGKNYTLKPGARTGQFKSRKVNGNSPTLYVKETGKSYKISNGNHKFFYSQSRGRIAFDQDYDRD